MINKKQNIQSSYWLEKRDEIVESASRLFEEKGYTATNMGDIANAANLNKATIYYYFKNKADILYEVSSRPQKEILEIAKPIKAADLPPGKKLEALICKQIEYRAARHKFVLTGVTERRNLPPRLYRAYVALRDEYEIIFRQVIEEGIASGEFRPLNVKLTSMFILGLLNSIFQWYKSTGELLPAEIAAAACDFALTALRDGRFMCFTDDRRELAST